MQNNKFKKQNLKIDIAYLQISLLTNALPCFYIHRESMTNTREFPKLVQFPAIISKIQQEFDSRQWSEEVHPSKISFQFLNVCVGFGDFNPMILALNAERKFVSQIQRRTKLGQFTLIQLNFRSTLFYRSWRRFIWASHSQVKKIKTNDPRTIFLVFMVDATYQVEYACVKVNPRAEEVVCCYSIN